MTPREIEQLLGGYATNTLSEEERRSLFAAALANQALFDALADEQALKELLEDPASRAHLLAALGEKRETARWLRWPSVVALSAAVAAAILVVAVVRPGRIGKPAETTVAQQTAPAPPPVASQPAPAISDQKAPAPKPQSKPRSEMRQTAEPPAKEEALSRPAPPPPAPEQFAAPPAAAPPPQPTGRVEERGQATASARGGAPAVTAPAAQMEARKQEAPGRARDLYDAAQPVGVVNGLLGGERNKETKEKTRAKAAPAFAPRSMGIAGRVSGLRAPGIRYTVEQRLPDGTDKEIDPAAPIGIGNRIRIVFQANQEGELSVQQRGSDGAWTPWGAAHLRAGESLVLPAGSFVTIAAPGEFRFLVRFSRTLQAAAKKDEKLAANTNLLREQSGNSVYVVNPVASPDAAVEFEFALTAQ